MKKIILIIVALVLIGLAVYAVKTELLSDTSDYAIGTPERIAEDFVVANSAEGITFHLEKDFDNGTFVKFYVKPTGKYEGSVDEARIYLKKTTTGYEVIGFGTAFPGLEEAYPELKGI